MQGIYTWSQRGGGRKLNYWLIGSYFIFSPLMISWSSDIAEEQCRLIHFLIISTYWNII